VIIDFNCIHRGWNKSIWTYNCERLTTETLLYFITQIVESRGRAVVMNEVFE